MTQNHKLRTYEGAVAVITGGASGIGRALGEALAQRGADVVLADRQMDLAEQVAAGIRTAGGKARAVELDVRDFEAFRRVVQDAAGALGRIDYLFNNAGLGVGGEVKLYQRADWDTVLDVNLTGVINGVQAAYPVMLEQGFGHLINTASMAGLMPAPGVVSYATSKFAVVGLSLSLRIEAEPAGVRVSALCPGVIRTSILEGGGKYGKHLEEIAPDKQRALWERLRPMAPEKFAGKVLRKVAKNKPIIVIPAWWKILWWLNRLSPRLGLAVARKMLVDNKKALGK